MTTLTYCNWTNLDARFSRPYQPGDRLVRGWQGELPEYDPAHYPDVPRERHLFVLAEMLFGRHNADDRPDGQMCPSMSIGDVVQFGETALSVDRMGFVAVSLDPNDLITDRPWSELMETHQ